MATKASLSKQSKENLVDQIVELEKQLANQPKKTDKEASEETTRAQNVKSAVAGLSAEKVAQELASVSVNLSNQIAKVSEELVRETRRLDDVREAVSLAETELETLHGKDIAASALDHLVLQYREQENELKEVQEEQKKLWARQQAEYQDAQRQRKEETDRTRTREEQQYAYDREQERKIEAAKWDDAKRLRNLGEEERMRNLERAWKDREMDLAKQEQEVAELRTKVTNFPVELDAQIKKAVGEASGSLHGSYKHQIALLQKDKDTSEAILNSQVKQLSDQVAKASTENEKLREQLTKVDQRVQEIASAAIQEAGSAKALTELRNMNTRVPENGSTPRPR